MINNLAYNEGVKLAENLTINDLKLMMQIISAVSERGAIKPGEMALVGSLYSKLESFVAAIQEPDGGIIGQPADVNLNEPPQEDESNDSGEKG